MRNVHVQKMVAVVMFAAIALVLQYFVFPITPASSFLKIDFSNISVLTSMFSFDPAVGVAAAFLRSVLYLLTTGFSPDDLIGDTASFLSITIFTFPIYYFFSIKKQHKGRNKFLGVITGAVVLTIFMNIADYFVITSLYLMFLGLSATQMLGMSLANYVLTGIAPFNLIKGFIVSTVFLILHAQLLPWLSRKQHQFEQRHTTVK